MACVRASGAGGGGGGVPEFGLNGHERPRRAGMAEGFITLSVPLQRSLQSLLYTTSFIPAPQFELRDTSENGKWKKNTHARARIHTATLDTSRTFPGLEGNFSKAPPLRPRPAVGKVVLTVRPPCRLPSVTSGGGSQKGSLFNGGSQVCRGQSVEFHSRGRHSIYAKMSIGFATARSQKKNTCTNGGADKRGATQTLGTKAANIQQPGERGRERKGTLGRTGGGGQTKRHPVSWNSTLLKSGAAWKQRTRKGGEKHKTKRKKKPKSVQCPMACTHTCVCVCPVTPPAAPWSKCEFIAVTGTVCPHPPPPPPSQRVRESPRDGRGEVGEERKEGVRDGERGSR